jgi:mRNA-degrading endonuclease toxin of MazEF toxin-antitoxin module
VHPLRGHFYWVTVPGEPRRKRRPALVVSVDARNRLATDVLVVPASTVLRPAPTHVAVNARQGGLPRRSVLKCEQLTTLPKELLGASPLGGPVPGSLLVEVQKAVLRAMGVPIE